MLVVVVVVLDLGYVSVVAAHHDWLEPTDACLEASSGLVEEMAAWAARLLRAYLSIVL
jgi:hypothetical protein